MVRRLAAVLALMLLAGGIAPETARTVPEVQTGFASAYSPGVMEGVVALRYRLGYWPNRPPRDPYTVDGFIASMDCSRVGNTTTLYGPDGRAYSVLIGDCMGNDGDINRFSDRNIIAELDGRLWAAMTAEHGTPLEIGVRQP